MRVSVSLCFIFAILHLKLVAENPKLEKHLIQTTQGWEYEVSNVSDDTLLAFQLVVQCPGSKSKIQQQQEDALMEFGGRAKVPPRTTRVIRIDESVSQCPARITAAIFEDGTIYGERTALQYLYDIRKGTYFGVTYAKDLIDKFSPSDDFGAIADALDAQRQKITANRTSSIATWIGETAALGYLAGVIRRGNEMHVPSDDTPKRQPFISDLAATKQIPRSQAQASIMSKKLYEWLAALEGNIEMPKTITSDSTF